LGVGTRRNSSWCIASAFVVGSVTIDVGMGVEVLEYWVQLCLA